MRQDILTLFCGEIRSILEKTKIDDKQLQEIRLRASRPLILKVANEEWFLKSDGSLSSEEREGVCVSAGQIRDSFAVISRHSYYAFADEISRGYLTVPGGHRVGICGKAIREDEECRGMRYVSFLNVRVAHEVRGCGERVVRNLYENRRVLSTLIISPPGGGKTTLMRDLIRLLSDGNSYREGVNVSVVDERSELAACYHGIPQHDLGCRSDVLDGCGKSEGIRMMIRSMGPQVIAVDEIGGADDVQAVEDAACCGCAVLATAHGESIEEIRRKPGLGKLVREGLFDRYLILSGTKHPGERIRCLDREGRELCRW